MEFLSEENKNKLAQAIKDCLASDNPKGVLEKYAEQGFTDEMLGRVIENYNVVKTIGFIEKNAGKDRLQEFPLLDKDEIIRELKEKAHTIKTSFSKAASVNIDRKKYYGLLYHDNPNIELTKTASMAKINTNNEFMLSRKIQELDAELVDTQLKIASLLEKSVREISLDALTELKKSASDEADLAAISLLQALNPRGNNRNTKSGYAVIQSLVDLVHKLVDILHTKSAYEKQKPKIKRVEKKAGLISNIATGFLLDSELKQRQRELSSVNREIEKTENLLALQELKKFEDKLKESITFKELMQDPIINNYAEEDVKKAWNMLYRFHPEVVRNPLTAKLVIRKMLETGQLDTFDIKDISEILKNMHSLESIK